MDPNPHPPPIRASAGPTRRSPDRRAPAPRPVAARRWAARLPSAVLAAGLLAACGGTPPTPLPALNASYEAALARTESAAADFAPGGDAERAALDRVQAYFARVTPDSVRAQTAAVYAPTAYLNDTLAAIEGAPAIEAYFVASASRAQDFRVEFLDRARTGRDYYQRWRMTVAADGLNGGAPVVTYGVTQFRFDSDGRVLLHKDFWDAGTGLYEQLPGIGGLVRRVRGAAHDASGHTSGDTGGDGTTAGVPAAGSKP